jgi:hypothetical protein
VRVAMLRPAVVGVVSPQSPKLELSYLKTEVRGGLSNLVTRPRAHMQEWPRGYGEAVRTSEQRRQGWLGRWCERVSGGASACSGRS